MCGQIWYNESDEDCEGVQIQTPLGSPEGIVFCPGFRRLPVDVEPDADRFRPQCIKAGSSGLRNKSFKSGQFTIFQKLRREDVCLKDSDAKKF